MVPNRTPPFRWLWVPFGHAFWCPHVSQEMNMGHPEAHENTTSLKVPTKTQSKSGWTNVFCLYFICGSGYQPPPIWVPQSVANQKTNNSKSRPKTCSCSYTLLFLLSLPSVCFPSCYLCMVEMGSAASSTWCRYLGLRRLLLFIRQVDFTVNTISTMPIFPAESYVYACACA